MDPVEPILGSGQDVGNHSHSLLAVVQLGDVRLQVEGTSLVGREVSQISLNLICNIYNVDSTLYFLHFECMIISTTQEGVSEGGQMGIVCF